MCFYENRKGICLLRGSCVFMRTGRESVHLGGYMFLCDQERGCFGLFVFTGSICFLCDQEVMCWTVLIFVTVDSSSDFRTLAGSSTADPWGFEHFVCE